MTRARILVMDDDPLFRSLLAATLRKDYLVSVAADGTEGYNKAVEHLPDLAVVDLQMPVCDGLAVLKAFRAHPTLRNVPVIILTGDNSKESVMSAIQLGVNDYVIKTSFSKPDFTAKVARLLATRSKVAIATPMPERPRAESAIPSPVAAPVRSLQANAVVSAPVAANVAAAAPLAASPISTSSGSDQSVQSILDNWD